MRIEVTLDASKLIAKLDAFEKRQAPFAMALALTKTAQDVRRKMHDDLPAIFDRPSPFTMNSLSITSATTKTYQSAVFVKPLQAKYLETEQVGGERTPGMNTRVPTAKAIVVPGKGMPLDRYGGIPRGELQRLKSAADQMRAARQAWRQSALRARNAPRPAAGQSAPKIPPPWPRDFGIFYWRNPNGRFAAGGGGYFMRGETGHFLKRMTAFHAGTHYNPRLNFYGNAAKHAKESFEANWVAALKQAIATTR